MKKIKILAGALALCAIAGVNVWNATIRSHYDSSLNLSEVEKVADGWEWSDVLGWASSRWYDKVIKSTNTTCTITYSDSYSANVTILGCGGGFTTPGTTYTASVPGTLYMIECSDGDGDCWSSKSYCTPN